MLQAFLDKWDRWTLSGQHLKSIPFSPEDSAEFGVSPRTHWRAVAKMVNEGLLTQSMRGGGRVKNRFLPNLRIMSHVCQVGTGLAPLLKISLKKKYSIPTLSGDHLEGEEEKRDIGEVRTFARWFVGEARRLGGPPLLGSDEEVVEAFARNYLRFGCGTPGELRCFAVHNLNRAKTGHQALTRLQDDLLAEIKGTIHGQDIPGYSFEPPTVDEGQAREEAEEYAARLLPFKKPEAV